MPQQIKVAIIGAGVSGLAVANGLLKDKTQRYDVQVYERDSIAFDNERGGYQLRIASTGLNALKTCSDAETWSRLTQEWGGDAAKAPSVVNPNNFEICLKLSEIKLYPQSRPIPRTGLRRALLHRPMKENRIHFSHQLDRFEKGEQGVKLYFKGQTEPVHADILIAGDGSNSVVNRQVGLNNKVKLKQWSLIQAQATINEETRNKLPSTLISAGSCMFLGGLRLSGFSSIYNLSGPSGREFCLFWTVLVPSDIGEKMIEKAGSDKDMLIPMLVSYLEDDMKLQSALPNIIHSATDRLRTGNLTSSVQPKESWRQRDATNSRIILLGDAVHPMTPGRGMGANQALGDAGSLVNMLNQATFEKDRPSDQDLTDIVVEFEKEMYSRAFEMVRKSEEVVSLDLTQFRGRALASVVRVGLTVAGWVVSLFEAVGLAKKETLDFLSQDH